MVTMFPPFNRTLTRLFLGLWALGLGAGCLNRQVPTYPSEVSAGLNARDLIDLPAQAEADGLSDLKDLQKIADDIRKNRIDKVSNSNDPKFPPTSPKSVLCLSGGGAYGAYSAGILCGWTCRGDRPTFDVVTGISTGALIAPMAFLGPKYDREVKRFYTTLESKDIYKIRYVRGLFSEALADNSPLAAQIDSILTPSLINEIAVEHTKGRRLYVGTTEAESRRFVVWDIGAIACRGTPRDRELIKQVLLGSSSIPGFFPPSRITVNVDGMQFTEQHVDGGVSTALFFRPPYTPTEQQSGNALKDLAGSTIYMIVAGKLFADPEVIAPWALTIASKNVSSVIYAQTRGDLQRIYTVSLLTGMHYRLAAIPADYPVPASSVEFQRDVMTAMFKEGYRQVMEGTAWRTTAPGIEFGEGQLNRAGTSLTFQQRGPILPPASGPRVSPFSTRSSQGIPFPFGTVEK